MSNDENASPENKMDYSRLIYYLKQGREIEFFYDEKEYFIPNYEKGRVILNEEGENLNHYIEDPEEFAEKAKINGLTLKDIFQNQSDKLEIGTIF